MSRPLDLVGRIGQSRAALAALLALALGVRLYAVYHARFDRDEAAAWETAVGIARGETLPSLGPGLSRSDARTPGPLFFYLMAIPHLVTPHPLAGGVFVALLNVGALALLFAAFRDGWDPAAAVLWLATTVCSPWSVAYADRMWTPDIFVPMLAVILWSAVRMGRVPESRAAGILAFMLVSGFQVHLPALYLWPIAAVALAVLRPRINRRWLAAGALAGALTYAPYVAHEMGTGFSNTRALLSQGPTGTLGLREAAGLVYLWLSMATTDASFLIARGYWGGFDPVEFWTGDGLGRTAAFAGGLPARAMLFAVLAAGWALVLGGLALLARRSRSEDQRATLFAGLFAASLASIVLVSLSTRRGGFAHYVSLLAPLAAVPLLVCLRRLLRGSAAWAAAAYLLAAPVVGLWLVVALYRLDSRQSIPQQERIVRYVTEQSGGRPFELVFGMPEGRAVTYGALARRLIGVRWPAAERAGHVFTVVPLEDLPAARPPGRVTGTLTLDTLAVVHSER